MSFKSSGAKTRPDRVKPLSTPTPAHPSTTPRATDRDTNTKPRSRRSSSTSTNSDASFHSAVHSPSQHQSQNQPTIHKFTPSVEALHLSSSNTLKSEANTHFARGDYSSALSTYDRAIAELPTYLEYELAVLQSNVAACHLRLEEWKLAVEAAERGWGCLETLDPTESKKGGKEEKSDGNENSEVVELPDGDDADEEETLRNLQLSDSRKNDIKRIRTKLLLRRARARYMLGTTPAASKPTSQSNNPFAQASQLTSSTSDPSTSSAWSHLSASLNDYTLLSSQPYFPSLPTADQKTVRTAMATLPGLVEKEKEKEVAEMMGKLKELGNGILRPFGLSTDMFKMEKGEGGGMNLRFDGGAKT